VKPSEILELVHVARPDAPYGIRRLARCYSIPDLAALARRRLPRGVLGYLDGGGESEYTLRRNRAAFDEWELVSHVLHDVSTVDTSTTILGTPTRLPLALAPVGAPGLMSADAELPAGRAAAHAGVPFSLSTLGSVTVEQLAAATDATLWFQLYVWGDRGKAKELVARATHVGYRALLVTADVSVRSKRERELHGGLHLPTPTLTPTTVLEGALHPWWCWQFLVSDPPGFPNLDPPSGQRSMPDLSGLADGTLCWDDLDWIRAAWEGPLVLKGVLTPDDARRAADAGVDGVVVSNHGGRQLDHAPATIDVLPAIADAVGDRIEVLLDSGVRRGTDICAALALGARAVLIGRPWLYGVAAAGEAGVRHAVDILADELRIAMGLIGARRIADLDRSRVRRRM
jgi:L-lactate dehydrogenase (cytochrome)